MRKLYYMGLEPYKARYTLQLQEWNRSVFEKRKIDYVIVPGDTLSNDQAIVTGQVLDAHGRTYFGMSQMMNLIKMMKAGELNHADVVYFEDMFQPGIESLPYILNQIDRTHRPRIAVRCLAQTIDPDDFVHVWGMQEWMGHYEKMVDSFADIILATNEEMVAHMKIAGWKGKIYNISGLAFGKDEVRNRVSELKSFHQRKLRVCFSARWDQEKQPDFYMDLIEEFHRRSQMAYWEGYEQHEIEFAVFSGSKLFNCALQDWVSNTVSEADALGCNVLYPAYRSFPETFANDPERLYIPWSINDALTKLFKLLKHPHINMGKISDYNDKTIDRICDIITGQGEQYLRMGTDYRKHVSETKY